MALLGPIIYARLAGNESIASAVTAIRPSQPEVNEQLPYLVFTIQSQDSPTTLSGQWNETMYSFTVEGYAVDESGLTSLMFEVKQSLHGWRGGDVEYCWITGESYDKQEKYHHGSFTANLWYISGGG